MTYKRVNMIGLGYIGLPTAAVLASRGVQVLGVDVKQAVVDTINRGEIHIVEPDLDMLVRGAVETGRLRAAVAPERADAFVIAVPTPMTDDRQADLSFIEAAAQSIAPVLEKGNLVVLESTSPVGTTEKLAAWLAEARPDLHLPRSGAPMGEPADGSADIAIAYCPERVLPGRVIQELTQNDRVIGGLTPACAEAAVAFYKIFVNAPCVPTNARVAELCKLAENGFRDVNIAYANELANVCERLDIDVWSVIELASRHPRVNILRPGPGVGGHCIAVDPWFIAASAPDDTPLIQAARGVNDGRPDRVMARVAAALDRLEPASRSEARIACLGLTFKANIDDVRESPALEVTGRLAKAYPGRVMAVDPFLKALPDALKGLDVTFTDISTAVSEAAVIVLLVDHQAFDAVPQRLLDHKLLVDTRGFWVGGVQTARGPGPVLSR